MTCTCPVESDAASAAEIVAETLHGHDQRARRDAHGRPHLRCVDGAAQEGRVFLMMPRSPSPTQLSGTTTRETSSRTRALRFLTAGSVDDGKSTLIGRLLFDSRAILADQLDALETPRRRRADRPVAADRRPRGRARAGHHDRRRLPLLRDAAAQVHHRRRAGPRAVHAQHGHRRGRQRRRGGAGRHHQARYWRGQPVELLPQTRRHALLAQLLRVPSIVFAVNKLDAVADPRRRLRRGAAMRCSTSPKRPASAPAGIVPVSALRGDNVATPSANWPWYDGPTLLQLLESLPATEERHDGALLLPVQYVARDDEGAGQSTRANPTRVFWGRIAHGRVQAGDTVQRLPERRRRAVVAEVRRAGEAVDAVRGRAVGRPRARPPARRLARRLDRHAASRCTPTQRFAPRWPGSTPSRRSSAASTGCATATAGCRRASPRSTAGSTSTRWPTPTRTSSRSTRSATSIVETQQPLPLERYADNRVGGALIVVDPASNRTSGALLVARPR